MFKILVVSGREKLRFNQLLQIEDMRYETLEFSRKAVEILSRIFPDTVFELLDLDEYAEKQSRNYLEPELGIGDCEIIDDELRDSKCDYCNCAMRDCSLCGSGDDA